MEHGTLIAKFQCVTEVTMYRIATSFALLCLASTGCLDVGYELADNPQEGRMVQGRMVQGRMVQGTEGAANDIAAMELTDVTNLEIASLSLNGTALTGTDVEDNTLAPADMVGLEFVVDLTNGEIGHVTLESFRVDDSTTTMHETGNQSNSDVYLYVAMISHDSQPTPYNLCGPGGEGMLVEGRWNDGGTWSDNGITFLCTSGVAAKCIRGWGYKPWKTMYSEGLAFGAAAMRDFHSACVRAAMADYCADNTSYTVDGTWIDIMDTGKFNRPYPETGLDGMFAYESIFVGDGPKEITRTRYDHLDPSAVGGCFTQDEIFSGTFTWDLVYSDSLWTDPSNAQAVKENRRILVSTSTACSHSPNVTGAPLASDCNACTALVCADEGGDPSCCENLWSESCVDEAVLRCGAQAGATPLPTPGE